MSVSFCGIDAEGTRIILDIAHPAKINMASANARNFLQFLALDPGDGSSGEVSMAEVRRAVMRARARFQRRAPSFTRPPTDTQRPGRARLVVGGIDEDYLARRLHDFERFLLAVAERGAVAISRGDGAAGHPSADGTTPVLLRSRAARPAPAVIGSAKMEEALALPLRESQK